MARLENIEGARERLRVIARLIQATHDALMEAIVRPTQRPTPEQQRRFSDTLEHMGEVREGFILSQRTSPSVSLQELRQLVLRVLLDWQWVEAIGLSLTPGTQVEMVGNQLIAYHQALVALGMLPRLPAQAITFPQPRLSYHDVPVPAMPRELLDRIEEIEHVLYQAGLGPLDQVAFDPLRRTYAFFEASSWLVTRYLPPILSGGR